jgi:Txe/YoeB family toxin of Txe-Axe toxin-antitoxin module
VWSKKAPATRPSAASRAARMTQLQLCMSNVRKDIHDRGHISIAVARFADAISHSYARCRRRLYSLPARLEPLPASYATYWSRKIRVEHQQEADKDVGGSHRNIDVGNAAAVRQGSPPPQRVNLTSQAPAPAPVPDPQLSPVVVDPAQLAPLLTADKLCLHVELGLLVRFGGVGANRAHTATARGAHVSRRRRPKAVE